MSNPLISRGYIRNHSDINYRRKEYLEKVDDQTHRNTVTKLRTATHCLATATDTFNIHMADNEKFICKICPSGGPEDANHLILHCNHPLHLQPHKILLKSIPKLAKLSPKNITLTILNCSFKNKSSENFQKIYKAFNTLCKAKENKTSIQWTTHSQIYVSNKKMIFGQKLFLNKKKCITHR